MANLKTLDSLGGFSVGNTTVVSSTNDAKKFKYFRDKNQSFIDSSTTHYILRGLNTAVLGLDEVGSQIILQRNSINFITANIIGVNNAGSGIISLKFESVVTNDSAGFVQELSTMETIIKDSIPEGQSWTVEPFDTGSADRFSYSTIRAGTTNEIKWVASVQVVSIDWV